MLRLGYKASAEQFGPRRLLDLAVAAEQHGFESVWTSDHFQPWRHTDGHAPNALAWLGAAAVATPAGHAGHERADPDAALQPRGRGAGLRHAGLPGARADRPRRRHRASRSTRSSWASSGRSRRSASTGSRRPCSSSARLFREELVTFEGEYYRTAQRDPLRPARGAGAHLHRGLRAGGGAARRAGRRRLHRHVRQGPGALHRGAAAGRGRGHREGRARR